MLGIDRRVLRATWTVFLFVLLIALLYLVRRTLVVFTLALFLAHLLGPVADWAGRFAPKHWERPATLVMVYLALLILAIAILIPLGATIGEQAAGLAARIPETLQQDPVSQLPLPAWLEDLRPRLSELLRQRMADLDREVLPLLSRAGESLLSGAGNLLAVVLIPILSFFFLKDAETIRHALVSTAGGSLLIEDILSDLHRLLAQYIRALVLLSAAAFASHAAAFEIAGMPYPMLLAGLAAVLEFIPVVGPLTAGALILLVLIFSGYPYVLGIAAFLVVYRIFQDYILNPYLMSAGAEIHPLLVLFGVLAGQQIAGIPGMFFSVPVMAACRVIVLRVWKANYAH